MYRWVRERHMIGIRGRNFMEAPWAGGIVLLGCVIIAMLLANLPATSLYYRHLLETDLSLMVHSPDAVSYTHLDVYKRQVPCPARTGRV